MTAFDFSRLVGRLWAASGIAEAAAVIRGGARQLVGADGVTLVLREGELCHYVDEDAIGPLWKGQRFPLEACISGWAMLHRRQAAIADILQDPRIPQEAYRPTFVRSLVMSPIRIREPLGAMGAYWRERREISEAELGTLQALADACANALGHFSGQRRARRARILVADVAAASRSARDMLAPLGEVSEADTFERALEALRAAAPDLLVVDYHFDEVRPYRLIHAARECSASMPILLARTAPLPADEARDASIRESYLQIGVSQYVVLAEEALGRHAHGKRTVLLSAVRSLLQPG